MGHHVDTFAPEKIQYLSYLFDHYSFVFMVHTITSGHKYGPQKAYLEGILWLKIEETHK